VGGRNSGQMTSEARDGSYSIRSRKYLLRRRRARNGRGKLKRPAALVLDGSNAER